MVSGFYQNKAKAIQDIVKLYGNAWTVKKIIFHIEYTYGFSEKLVHKIIDNLEKENLDKEKITKNGKKQKL